MSWQMNELEERILAFNGTEYISPVFNEEEKCNCCPFLSFVSALQIYLVTDQTITISL